MSKEYSKAPPSMPTRLKSILYSKTFDRYRDKRDKQKNGFKRTRSLVNTMETPIYGRYLSYNHYDYNSDGGYEDQDGHAEAEYYYDIYGLRNRYERAPYQVIKGGCPVDIGLEGLLTSQDKASCYNCDGTWCTLAYRNRLSRNDILAYLQ